MKAILAPFLFKIFYFSSFFGRLLIFEDAREIVKKADEKMRGKTSKAEVTIQIVRPTWSREIKLKTWSKGNKYSLILIASPAKEKGIVFLKRDKEVWNWIPSIERVIRCLHQ